MKALKIDHIGIAVEKEGILEKIAAILGAPQPKEVTVENEGLKIKFIQLGDVRLELLYPISEKSTVKKFIENRGPGIHHIAIEVKNIEVVLNKLKEEGFKLIDEIPRVGAEGYKAAFVHPKSTQGVLLELVEY